MIPPMSTLATLFASLAAARRAGEDFDLAWEAASVEALGASCDPADWAAVLASTRPSWQAAYNDRPATSPERAVGLLGEGMETRGPRPPAQGNHVYPGRHRSRLPPVLRADPG